MFHIMAFTGNAAPFHITQPSTDNDVQIVFPTATMASVACSLNVTIPSSVIVLWLHNGSLVDNFIMTTTANEVMQTGNTATLLIRNLQPSDAGVYQCIFHDVADSEWILRRNIMLFITGMLM